jgi:hypothetical protein
VYHYKIGTVVRQNKASNCLFTQKQLWGHIIGFSQVHYESGNETILVVRWENGEQYSVHPNNVELGDTQ